MFSEFAAVVLSHSRTKATSRGESVRAESDSFNERAADLRLHRELPLRRDLFAYCAGSDAASLTYCSDCMN